MKRTSLILTKTNFIKKRILILLCLPLIFSSCQKCQECEPPSDTIIVGYDYQVNYTNDGVGDPIVVYDTLAIYGLSIFKEVCRDNFATDQKYNSYINYMEDDLGYNCKSDFWN